MTDDDLNELERLAGEATEGPWRPDPSNPADVVVWAGPRGDDAILVVQMGPPFAVIGEVHPECAADAAFIAAAREAVPALIAEVRRRREVERQLVEALEHTLTVFEGAQMLRNRDRVRAALAASGVKP